MHWNTTTQDTPSLPLFWPLSISLLVLLSISFFIYQTLTIVSLQEQPLSPAPTMNAPPPRHRNRTRNRKGKHSRLNTVVPAKAAPPSPAPISIVVNPCSKVTSLSIPSSPTTSIAETLVEDPRIKQPYDAFLVLDVEATCSQGVGFDYPNEIIEWPVVLLRWGDRDEQGRASELVKVAEFRSYVRPTWRPILSPFCTALTGITQADVDPAPTWPEMLESFASFLADNGLIDPLTGARLERFMFCSDGPFDVRDFVVKQCFISQIPIPAFLRGDILDTRKAVTALVSSREQLRPMNSTTVIPPSRPYPTKRVSLNIPLQLHALSLQPFIGRQHCGIDDARNIARILTELGRLPMRLEANTYIHPHRKWWWMGKDGEISFPDSPPPPYQALPPY